uniref:Uncharacterized protein n=1 Tax=Azotobacter salinestris TaxID=69964 RepID=Q56S09_AZOSA|nr:hypothetical protein [Azotobacter salinestris]
MEQGRLAGQPRSRHAHSLVNHAPIERKAGRMMQRSAGEAGSCPLGSKGRRVIGPTSFPPIVLERSKSAAENERGRKPHFHPFESVRITSLQAAQLLLQQYTGATYWLAPARLAHQLAG